MSGKNTTRSAKVLTPDLILNAGEEDDEVHREFKVDALQASRPFYTINPATGKREMLGRLGYTDYDKDNRLRVMVFRPKVQGGIARAVEAGDEEDGGSAVPKDYNLGLARGSFRIIDHAEVLSPFTELGFQISKMNYLRGGTRAMATLKHPDVRIKDPIAWDLEQFETVPAKRELFFSIGIWMDARAQHGIHAAAGFFRLICTNGLISSVLGMGSLNITHRRWSVNRLQEWAEQRLELVSGRSGGSEFPTMSTKALGWGAGAIRNLVDKPDELETLPSLARGPLTQLSRMAPDKSLLALADQLDDLRKGEKEFGGLDVLNAITNAGRVSNGNGLALRQERLTSSVMNLVQLGAFRAGVKYTLGTWGHQEEE